MADEDFLANLAAAGLDVREVGSEAPFNTHRSLLKPLVVTSRGPSETQRPLWHTWL